MERLNEMLYADEQETSSLRVGDAIPPIEARLGLEVTEIVSIGRENVKSEVNALRFQGKPRPDALWWFRVRCGSPEGAREALLSIALYGRILQVVSVDTPPKLLFFRETLRARAKEEASTLAREYIEQLEDTVRRGYLLWKTTNEYGKDLPDLREELYSFYMECKKVNALLPDAEDGQPYGLGLRKLYLPEWQARFPDQ